MILLIGNLDPVSLELARILAKRDKVLVADTAMPKVKYKNVAVSDMLSQGLEIVSVFATYSFDLVVFIPPRENRNAHCERGGFSQLIQVLDACVASNVKQAVLLSSSVVYAEAPGLEDGAYTSESNLCALLGACESLCGLYRDQYGLNVTVLHVPALFSDHAADALLFDAVRGICDKRKVLLPAEESDVADFLHVEDLADFLFRFHDEPLPAATQPVINLPGTGNYTFGTFREWLLTQFPNAKVELLAEPLAEQTLHKRGSRAERAEPTAFLKSRGTAHTPVSVERYPMTMRRQTAKRAFDWQAYVTLEERADTLLPALCDGSAAHARRRAWLKTWSKPLLVALELALGWVLLEVLLRVSAGSMTFGFLDYRLLFIVIFSIVHGMRVGEIAAIIATISYIGYSVADGIGWQAMFLNFTNWLPAVAYFLIATVVGYTRNRLVALYGEEKELRRSIEEKYVFLYDLYNQTVHIKEDFKDQIIGYSDSYGRFFKAVQMLDSMIPSKIYLNAIGCMEDFLENRAIAIYSLDKTARYARLQMNSAAVANTLKASYDLSDHPAMHAMLKENQIYCNQQFHPNEPAYAIPIDRNGEIVAVIMLWAVTPKEYSSDYVNKIRVMTGLVRISIVRALDYELAIESQRYLPGTHILRAEPFTELCKLHKDMRDREMAMFYLLRIRSKLPVEEIDRQVQTSIRQTDAVGIGPNGSIYILLSQADEKGAQVIRERLERKGVSCA